MASVSNTALSRQIRRAGTQCRIINLFLWAEADIIASSVFLMGMKEEERLLKVCLRESTGNRALWVPDPEVLPVKPCKSQETNPGSPYM